MSARNNIYKCYDESGKLICQQKASNVINAAHFYFEFNKNKNPGDKIFIMDQKGNGPHFIGFEYNIIELVKPIEKTIYDNLKKEEFKVIYTHQTKIEKINVPDSLIFKIFNASNMNNFLAN